MVSWSTTPDPDGTEPALQLTADRGGPYDLPAGIAGSAQFTMFTLSEAGSYEFTLTAATPAAASTPVARTESVRVHGVPSVTLGADPLVFDDVLHGGVTLTWVAANANASLEIFEVVPGGPDVLLHAVPEGDRASGSFVAGAPAAGTTYRIVATNGLAMTASAEITVAVRRRPAEILAFTATPPVYPPSSFTPGRRSR